jgi:gluconate 5-dehydrogenase
MANPLTQVPDLSGAGVGLTGGGGHLGRALALGLAGAGATVVICGRRGAALEAVAAQAERSGLPGRVLAQPADLRADGELAAVLDRIEAETGGVHGWINNACDGAPEPLMELTREKAEASVSGALTDLMVATRAVAQRMVAGGGGAIVNVSSMYGMVSPQPATYEEFPEYHNPPAYGAAKAGVIQFTRYAACHLAPRGIRVNCLSPGPFPRPEIRAQQGFVSELCKRVPLGRVGDADELVGPAIFLLSGASSYVTGHNLVVDGGWTAW